MKITTQQEFDITNSLARCATLLAQVSDDQKTKCQCVRCAAFALEAMSYYLGGIKE